MLVRTRLLAALAAVAALLAPGLAQAKWLKAETPRFILYSNGSEQTLREYAVKLEDFDTLLRVFFALNPDGVPARKLEMYLVADSVDIRRLAPGASDSLAGFYSASSHAIFFIGKRGHGKGDEDDTILHEYAHHFMMQYLAGKYPGWLIEGFAEYYMTAKLKTGSFEIGGYNTGRAYQLMSRPWTPTEVVLSKRTNELKGDQVFGYYAQSWLMTHYMLSDPERRKQLFTYVRLLGQGKESIPAWTESTGESLESLDARLKVYMRKGMPSTRFTRASYKPATVAVLTMPKSADDFLLESVRAQLTGCGADREAPNIDDGSDEEATREAEKEAREEMAFLERIRTRAALYPDDGLAQRTLACLELEDGDKAVGLAILDRLIAADPQDAASLRLKAQSLLAQARDAADPALQRKLMNDAGRLLLKANAAEPNDYRTLLNYARSRLGEPDYPNDNILDVLGNAAVLAPQVDDVSIETARALMMRRRWDEAEKLLTPVANNPHGKAGAAIARTMLAEIERKRNR
ncbi:MAG: hypothetical protein Q8J89_12030 [Caulobacter sp.]|nr:hypothetical protein [Caulobacter sp.]